MGATTLSIMTLSVKGLQLTFSIITLSIKTVCHYAECHYAEYPYAECHGALNGLAYKKSMQRLESHPALPLNVRLSLALTKASDYSTLLLVSTV